MTDQLKHQVGNLRRKFRTRQVPAFRCEVTRLLLSSGHPGKFRHDVLLAKLKPGQTLP